MNTYGWGCRSTCASITWECKTQLVLSLRGFFQQCRAMLFPVTFRDQMLKATTGRKRPNQEDKILGRPIKFRYGYS